MNKFENIESQIAHLHELEKKGELNLYAQGKLNALVGVMSIVKDNEVLDIVSKPLSDLKKLLAEMTIELITTEQDCGERHKLVSNIEIAKESINALK